MSENILDRAKTPAQSIKIKVGELKLKTIYIKLGLIPSISVSLC